MRAFILTALASLVSAIPTISVTGSKFFKSDGSQFFLKGIAYQLTNDDPLAQGDQCRLDANLMKTLGTNSIRVYHVDPNANHDVCMQAFADAGIYVFLDLDTFDTYIQLLHQPPRWNSNQRDAFAAVMDAFHGYDNVGGFFVGNEVLNGGADSPAAPYVKAAARDMKAYRDSKGYRKIPVGYSATDAGDIRPHLQNYLACGDNSADAIDFFGLNAYEWCGTNNFQQSGYAALQKNASSYNIPIFFSETGCNVPLNVPRTFEDMESILGPDMDGTWSGAIVYEWIQEDNAYGLISYGPPAGTSVGPDIAIGFTRRGTPTPIQPGFDNLGSRWKTLNPTGVAAAAYTPSLPPPACPAYTEKVWMVDPAAALPSINQVAASRTIVTTRSTTPALTTGPPTPMVTSTMVITTGASSGKTTVIIQQATSPLSSALKSSLISSSATSQQTSVTLPITMSITDKSSTDGGSRSSTAASTTQSGAAGTSKAGDSTLAAFVIALAAYVL